MRQFQIWKFLQVQWLDQGLEALQLCSTLSQSLEVEADIVDLREKCVFFEEGFDFVVQDNTEDLQDGHVLVSDLEIPASAIARLGFGNAATLFDVVIVAQNGRGHCGSESKICMF